MTALPLKIGVSDSDRTRPIASGEVPIAGVSADVTLMGVQALFNKQLTEHSFDCCEFPLSSYLRFMERPDRPYVAVPVFPSRHFRLSNVFVNAAKGIRKPADLAGKRIGVPVFDMAAAVWLRGIFQDHYDLARTSPIYVAGGLETARTGDEHPQFYPDRFRHEQRHDQSLAVLLAKGEIDALYTARAPSTWPSASVTRLFEDPMRAELDYFSKTGIFPPMHLIAVKRTIAEANPGLMMAIYQAFAQAQKIARERLFDSAALCTMLPWQLENLLSAEQHLGNDYWPVGLAKNRAMLKVVTRYMVEDGLIATEFSPEQLFSDPDILKT
ncbi:ABC transporter substrate-binding protein [Bradyrhizobium sp. dw_78]|uniref:ABC transporter substrate-binding protein n=1 Tax=Bradyrhizobium sp. dw_78 TaxID=2719793 RepID=UPI001BD21F9A|nr:ABC transporter substrate-binding protein [Bradyrhizobium sp. dw_78]